MFHACIKLQGLSFSAGGVVSWVGRFPFAVCREAVGVVLCRRGDGRIVAVVVGCHNLFVFVMRATATKSQRGGVLP